MLGGILAIIFSITSHAADFDYAPYLSDPWIKNQVEFWIKMYTEYTSEQGVIHDAGHVTVVYETLDFRTCRGKCKFLKVLASRERWKKVLRSLAEKSEASATPDLTADEKHVQNLYAQIVETNKYYEALQKKRMRFQLGQKDRFLDALRSSGQYLPMMEEVFSRESVPKQLTRIPFVESSFNVGARSKVGAAGMWQFMKATGKLYLKISDEIDERRDPVRATEAAARLLRANYDALVPGL